jgi:hypothetical protein
LPFNPGPKQAFFPSGACGEHNNGTILSTAEIIAATCGENPKPGNFQGIIFLLYRHSGGGVYLVNLMNVWCLIGPRDTTMVRIRIGASKKIRKMGRRPNFYVTSTDFWELSIQSEIRKVLKLTTKTG